MPFVIVLVGSGDVGRTVLAQALLRRELDRLWLKSAGGVELRTAGVTAVAGTPPSPHLETVAGRRGLAVDDHRAEPMTGAVAGSADLLLTMTRAQLAQLVLQYPDVRSRAFSLVEFAVLLHDAVGGRRRAPVGHGERFEAKLRQVTRVVAARRRVVPPPAEESGWDLFDPYAYSLDVYESVAAVVEDVVRTLTGDVARITGGRPSAATSRTA
ncbi:arsenate reductase/protein-tyrosine-phosphatase family protein [Amnibacterium sp.]|uniref:arsenate reductase/protein-tyrosine-phosphatase family protein n=1 Tax=Amnibacterium sp. TaxID=1872496 RepID=UPI003F7C97EE